MKELLTVIIMICAIVGVLFAMNYKRGWKSDPKVLKIIHETGKSNVFINSKREKNTSETGNSN